MTLGFGMVINLLLGAHKLYKMPNSSLVFRWLLIEILLIKLFRKCNQQQLLKIGLQLFKLGTWQNVNQMENVIQTSLMTGSQVTVQI